MRLVLRMVVLFCGVWFVMVLHRTLTMPENPPSVYGVLVTPIHDSQGNAKGYQRRLYVDGYITAPLNIILTMPNNTYNLQHITAPENGDYVLFWQHQTSSPQFITLYAYHFLYKVITFEGEFVSQFSVSSPGQSVYFVAYDDNLFAYVGGYAQGQYLNLTRPVPPVDSSPAIFSPLYRFPEPRYAFEIWGIGMGLVMLAAVMTGQSSV